MTRLALFLALTSACGAPSSAPSNTSGAEIAALRERLDAQEARLDAQEERIAVLEAKIDHLETKLSTVHDLMQSLRGSLQR